MRFYFVQGFETWDFPRERVEASWRLPFRIIAVSEWLVSLIRSAGVDAWHLPNGLDHEAFGIDRNPRERREPSIIFPWHVRPQKGSADAVAAIHRVCRENGAIRIVAFGTGSRPRPRTVEPLEYYRSPSANTLRHLLNESQVAIAPSHAEGWGLPACEALQCGCALAASNVGGHREFLVHGQNALLYDPGDVEQLATHLIHLLNDADLRARLALRGTEDMRRYTVSDSASQLMAILAGNVGMR